MSRQMACQLSALQIVEWAKKALLVAEGNEGKHENFGSLLASEVPDPKDRVRMGTAIVVLSELSKEGLTVNDVRQAIRWRNDDGNPGPIEIQYTKSGRELRTARIMEERRIAHLREAVRMFGPMILFR